MIRLLRHNLLRLYKNKFLWICPVLYMVYSLVIGITYHYDALNLFSLYELGLEDLLYCGFPAIGFISLLVTSSFFGTDIKNHSLRNCLAIGYTKKHVYLSELFACMIYVVALNAVFSIATFTIASIGEKWDFGVIAWGIFLTINGAVLASTCVSIYTLLTVSTKNPVISLIVGIPIEALMLHLTLVIGKNVGGHIGWLTLIEVFFGGSDFTARDIFFIFFPVFVIIIAEVLISAITSKIGVEVMKKSNLK